jgi:hypothetical protein
MTPEDIAYLRAQVQARGYSADDLLNVINYESSGRPTAWGGTDNKYFGLIQFGPNERKTYGVDVAHPNARNQIDAAMRFLADRGFKPGMGLQDMYSTVLAGSPGHYNRSDGAGTVAQHVARMQGGSTPGMTRSSSPDMGALAYAGSSAQPSLTTPKADPIGELLSMQPAAKKQDPIAGLLSSMQQQPQRQKTSMDDDFVRQMMDLHSAQHQRAIQGLL